MSTNRRIFLLQMGMGALGASLVSGVSADLFAETLKGSLPRNKPEALGISSAAIQNFFEQADKSNLGFHSIMVLRKGQVVAEGWWAPYAAKYTHTLYSLSKSFTSTAVGLAIAEGRFSLDSPVISFFPADLPAIVSDNLAAMNVQHLLTMSTGHVNDTINGMRRGKDPNWAKVFLEQPVEKQPGTHFLYNTGATYMLSAIVQKKTGKNLMQYMKSRFFDPLGIEGMDWQEDPRGINVGGYGLRVKTEDIAKLGHLYLEKGIWDSVEILPKDWVGSAISKVVNNAAPDVKPGEGGDWSQGYGYQFWQGRHKTVRGDGAFGQFCMMIPDSEIVIAVTSESFNMGAQMQLMWDHFLPAIKTGALPAEDGAWKMLQDKLKSLSLTPPQGNFTSPRVSTLGGREIRLEANDFKVSSMSFKFGRDCVFTFKDDAGVHSIKCGWGKWIAEEDFTTKIVFPLVDGPKVSTPVAASAVWTDTDTLMVTLRYFATAHGDNLIFKFEDSKVTLSFLNSVSKGNPSAKEERKPVTGTF